MASQQQARTMNLRKSAPEDMKYIITQFHRPIDFLGEFSGPVYFRKRTYVDEAEEINYGPDTETARIKNARSRNEAKNMRRQQREEEYQNYLKSQEEEKKQSNPSEESDEEEDEESTNQDTKPENATATSSSAPNAQNNTNGAAKPKKQMKKMKRKKNTGRVRGKRNSAYVIEDESQTKGFEGTVMTPPIDYAILLLQGGEFKLIFTDPQWITFKPKQIFSSANTEEEVTQSVLDAELAAAERAMKAGVRREKDQAKFLVKDEDQLQQLMDQSKAKSAKPKKREEADYRFVADDDEEVQVKSELTSGDIMEDEDEDEDDEMDKKLAKGMDIDTEEEEDDGAEYVKKLLKEYKDPEMLIKKAEEAKKQEEANKALQKKLEEEKLAKEKAKKKEASPSDTKITAVKKEEDSKAFISAPPPKKVKREEPPTSSSTTATAVPALSIESEVALLKTDLISFLKQQGGKASLSSVRRQFISPAAYPTEDAKKARLKVLIQVIKAVCVKEGEFVILKT